jgi:hypothetical protein
LLSFLFQIQLFAIVFACFIGWLVCVVSPPA